MFGHLYFCIKPLAMDIEQFRDYCLSLPATHEGTPFDGFYRNRPNAHSVLVFFVADKMFCYFDIDTFDKCTIKCAPEEITGLKEKYNGIGDPYNGNPKYWISVGFNSDVPDSKLVELVKKSYDLVVGKLSKKVREEAGM